MSSYSAYVVSQVQLKICSHPMAIFSVPMSNVATGAVVPIPTLPSHSARPCFGVYNMPFSWILILCVANAVILDWHLLESFSIL